MNAMQPDRTTPARRARVPARRGRRDVSVVAATILALAATAAAAGETELISVHAFTGEAAGQSALRGADTVSADGRYVVFQSRKYSLVPADTNRLGDIFVRDRWFGTTRRVSVASNGAQSNGYSDAPSISADGRYVVFQTDATNLVPNGPPGSNIYLHDTSTGRTELISAAFDGSGADQGSYEPSVSRDGRYVAFMSTATNLIAGYVGRHRSVYVRDRAAGRTTLVSEGWAYSVVVSADGRSVAFDTDARMSPEDVNGSQDVYVRDQTTGVVELVSVTPAGFSGLYGGSSPSLSADGRYVAFSSRSPNLVPDDSNGTDDVFVRDRHARTTSRVSLDASGRQIAWGGQGAQFGPSISADGRFVTFVSTDPFVVPGDANGAPDGFVRDTWLQRTRIVTVGSDGRQGYSQGPITLSVAGSGRYVAFDSYSAGLVPNDVNYADDVFVRDLGSVPAPVAPAFTLRPAALDFGDQPVGSATARSFWLRNTGDTPLTVTRLRVRGEDAAMYAAVHRCGAALPAGTGCAIRVTYRPTSQGLHAATLVVVIGDELRRTRPLSGRGTAP